MIWKTLVLAATFGAGLAFAGPASAGPLAGAAGIETGVAPGVQLVHSRRYAHRHRYRRRRARRYNRTYNSGYYAHHPHGGRTCVVDVRTPRWDESAFWMPPWRRVPC